MAHADYSRLIDSVGDAINIYDGPEVFLATFSQVPHEAGLLYSASFCQSEVCNGGFHQFFWNSTGVLAPEAVEGFCAIGQLEIAALIREAMAILCSPYLRERTSRQAALELLADSRFDAIDKRFYALIDEEAGGFLDAANRYASQAES